MVKVVEKVAKPFVKWAGGKARLASTIDKLIHENIKLEDYHTYVEPFVGGGAMFFYIASKYQFEKFIISDVNAELINTYKAIKTDYKKLISNLEKLQTHFNELDDANLKKEYYYQIRDSFNKLLCHENSGDISYEKAAYFIFLNKCGFNGLYRVNQKGMFNVPFGQKKTLNLYEKDNLLAVHSLLQNADIYVNDYKSTLKYSANRTFFYFDPPYRPITTTASFTAYSKSGFNDENQIELASFCKSINKRGASFALSNSDPHNKDEKDMFFDDLYKDFSIYRINANRAIGAKSNSRGKVSEIVVIG